MAPLCLIVYLIQHNLQALPNIATIEDLMPAETNKYVAGYDWKTLGQPLQGDCNGCI